MKTGKTLAELAAEIQRQNEVKKDYLADTTNLKVSIESDEPGFSLEMRSEGANGAPNFYRLSINDIAHRQIGEHTNIPAKYYDRCRAEFPELLAANVNGWFERKPAQRMIRTLDGAARAFLSDRYRRIDNYDIATTVLPILGEMDVDTGNGSFEITDSKMYIKAVNPASRGK